MADLSRRRLDVELVRRKLVTSRADARRAIEAGLVEVGGIPQHKPASLVSPDISIRLSSPSEPYVSRGGRKLEAALEAFSVVVAGRRALDVGASTGGFTDCLLQRHVASVVALDVGYGQLDWTIRNHPAVVVVERTNFRHVDVASIGGPFDVVVGDLSFISLQTLASALAAAGTEAADWILLVKPQFELEPGLVGRGGIVRDVGAQIEAVQRAVDAFAALGLGLNGVVPSPITGAKGNQEYLVWLRRGPATVEVASLREADSP